MLLGSCAGKTRTGAEWIREQVFAKGKSRIALVAPSINDAREVMLEGESGLLNIGYPSERPFFSPSRRRLDWPNGAVGHIFTAEDPDGLRGPQFDAAWADEFCAWAYPEQTLSNLRLALRLGRAPQLVITTTPRPIPALKALLKSRGLLISRGTTADNADNLAPTFLSAMEDAYGGTRLGRQELGGEYIEDLDGALWTRAMLETAYTSQRPNCSKIIIAIDPPVTSGENSDACGIIVAGTQGHYGASSCREKAFILHDGTVEGRSPEGWAKAAVQLARQWEADYILAETNQGGELVSSVLNMVDPSIPVRSVYASRSKTIRAEPVALLYEKGRVAHCGHFQALEDELTTLGTEAMRRSPDRADALVWAVSELLLKSRAAPRVRHL
ncbi:DNA-packaging protein [Hellea balneolensis]|uniref:DNA-packaging protein n=1 Tax=Hellea balneolensis TaxID=287478 RepID=UPI0003FAAD6E|nr:terminase family protein [Hellea balneolensis]